MPDTIDDPATIPTAKPARSGRAWLIIVLGLALLAGGLRFVRLGHWPFAFDEVASFQEIDSLVNPHPGPLVDQIDRLPRMIPLGVLVSYAGDRAFGSGEFGSRVLMAILGTIGVILVFALLDGPSGLGRSSAVAAALMVAVWPDHLFHSQYHRFYMTAWFCASLAMLLGGRAASRRSPLLMASAALMGLAAIASHTLQGTVLVGLAAGTAAASRIERRRLPTGQLAVLGVALAIAAAAYVVHIGPLSARWNGGEPTEGPIRSLMAGLNHLGWPVIALSVIGGLTLLRSRPGAGAYWIALAATWLGSTLFLPIFVPYSAWYGFPIALPVLVLAGAAAGRVHDLLLPTAGRWVAAAWLAVACTLNLPSTASYYADGSRPDYREAARYINDNWRDGDRAVAQMTPGILPHYLRAPASADYLKGKSADDQVASLDDLSGRPGRLWIVVIADRAGLPWKLRDWLSAHAQRLVTTRKRRFDYSDNVVELYIHDPGARPPKS